jgi:hypothetical protein
MPKANWKNRIVGHGEKPAADFNLNELNWRRHPDGQQRAIDAVLSQIGWVTGVIVNVTTGNVIDGHLRIERALERGDKTPVPFTEVELTEDEEQKILLVLDPIGSMATTDADALRTLLELAAVDSEDLLTAIASITGAELPDAGGDEPNLADPAFNYQSQFGVIVQCDDEAQQEQVFNALSGQGYKVKVVVV